MAITIQYDTSRYVKYRKKIVPQNILKYLKMYQGRISMDFRSLRARLVYACLR